MKAGPAIRAAMRGHEPAPEQWRAISHPPEPLAIIAGAGSGKTAIMAARMVWMVQEGIVRPSQILGLTFTNKAADELEERINLAFEQMEPHTGLRPPDLPAVQTYNSFADRLVREHGVRIGIDPDSALLSQAQTWQLLAACLDQVEPFDAIDSRSIASLTRTALGLADQCANHCVTPEEVAQADKLVLERRAVYQEDMLMASRRRIELTRVVRAYQNAKRNRRCMDFGDQVAKAVDILERWPEVAADLRGRFPAILLDEYQDTNVAQRKLMQALAPEGANVTAVGDARQNIFQWRGSTLFNLIDFPESHFLRSGGRRHAYLSLSENFRSGSRIVEVANAVIDRVPAQRRPGKPLGSVSGNLEGFVGTSLLSDQQEEAAFIGQEILRLRGIPAGPGRPATRWKDFAILVRRKSHMGPIFSVLKSLEVPVEVVGLGGLLQTPEVVDTVAWLRVIADPGPGSNRWLARILMGPRFRVHYRDLAVLARWAASRTRALSDTKRKAGAEDGPMVPDETAFDPDEVAFSLVESLDHLEEIAGLPADARQRLETMVLELRHLRSQAGISLPDLVQRIVSGTGIADALRSSLRKDASASLANLRQFTGLVEGFSPLSGDPSLSEFLDYLDAAEDAEDKMELEVTPADDSVKLTTVHRAKGLEFEVVFIPAVAARENDRGLKVHSIFPDERSSNPLTSYGQLPYGVREDRQHLPDPMKIDAEGKAVFKGKSEFALELKERAVEDERRLFYVALTRAKQRLYVTAAWWYERQSKPHGPSVFFDEVAGHPASQDLGRAPAPVQSPLMAQLQARAVWPPRHRPLSPPSQEFPNGPVAELERLLAGELSAQELLCRLPAEDRQLAEVLLAEHRKMIGALDPRADPPGLEEAGSSRSMTVSQTVELAAGRLSPAQLVRPLPRRPSPASRTGTQIHRWIEELGRGLTGLADEEALEPAGVPEEPAKLAELKEAFIRMGFASRQLASLPGGEPMAEVRFLLKVGEDLIRGRMDAVYVMDGGGLEIVDFKSGAVVETPELDQLMIYAAALGQMGLPAGAELKLTYCYLSAGRSESRVVGAAATAQALKTLQSKLEAARQAG